jgi:UDP-N-acetylmuramate dehydrogenase
MHFLTDNLLAHYVTMRIGGPAKAIAIANSEQDVVEAVKYAEDNKLRLISIGKGSNIVFTDSGFNGLVLINKISELIIDKEAGFIAAGSGVLMDDIVRSSVEYGLVGIEALSGIPGTVGAAPVNNIGAYGQEIKDTLVAINAYDTFSRQFIDITNEDCKFEYRDSLFKSKAHGRYIIVKVMLKLRKADSDYKAPNYPSLLAALKQRNITHPAAKDIRKTILDLRAERLPDPAKIANTGSFFKNPSVSKIKLKSLLSEYPDMPHFPQANGNEKLAAGWLIDKAGLRNYRQDGFWVYDKQALVLVNEKSARFDDLAKMSDYVIEKVKAEFGVILQIEPEII